jgi:hypothetical protein
LDLLHETPIECVGCDGGLAMPVGDVHAGALANEVKFSLYSFRIVHVAGLLLTNAIEYVAKESVLETHSLAWRGSRRR